MAIRPSRSLTTVALSALALAAAACSDSVTQSGASLRPDEARLTVASTASTTFTIDPNVTNVYQSAEGHRITIPAGSICKPGTAYGPAHWNSACVAATAPITFTISTFTTASGRAALDVQPDVRFVPTKTVTAFMKDASAASRAGSYIEYCTASGCVDEGVADADMRTSRDPATGYVHRRLKHFSGYNVVFGRSCESDPSSCGGEGMESRSPIAPVSANLFAGRVEFTPPQDR